MSRIVIVTVALSVTTAVATTTNTWTGAKDDWNWNDSGNYSLGLPASDDVVEIPDATTVRLLATDTSSFSVVNGLHQIRPTGAGSKLVVITDASHDATLSCRFASGLDDADNRYGELVKQGAGTLSLGNGSDLGAYHSTFTVESGVLRLPTTGRSGYSHLYSRFNVNEGATLFTVGNKGYTVVQEILGRGVVTNDWTAECYLQIAGGTLENPTKVEAQLGGMVRLYTYGIVDIMSAANTMPSSSFTSVRRKTATSDSVLGLVKIGNSGAVGSPGTAQFLRYQEYGGTLRYLGAGEDTSKGLDINMNAPHFGVCEFDGGPSGGLKFTSSAIRSTYKTANLVLSGANASPCTIACPVNTCLMNGTNTFVNFTKRGSGTWRFAHRTDRLGIGNISVEEGTLQFDSLYETGDPCSLGMGVTNWACGHYGLNVPEKLEDYSIALGDPDDETVPTFEFVGSSSGAWNTTRTIAMRGDAKLVNSSAGNGGEPLPMRLANFSNIVDRTTTLVLGGDEEAAENQVANLKDGKDGKIVVVKTGTTTWSLTGTNNTFSGGLFVSNGTLRVLAPDSKYTWFRWTVKETKGQTVECKAYILGLYDSDWNRINGGLSLCSDYAAIKANQVAHQKRMVDYNGKGSRDLDKLFSSSTLDSTLFDFIERVNTSGTSRGAITLEDEGSWIRCLMRLDPNCNEAASYDLAVFYNSNQNPGNWSLDGSVNGIEWDVLHENSSSPFTDSRQWAFGRTLKAAADAAASHTNGQAIVGHGLNKAKVVPSGCPVAVSPGAVLEAVGTVEIDSLCLSVSGNGTFKGVAFAATGTVNVESLAAGCVSYPCTFLDADGESVAPNLSRWTLSVGGTPKNGTLRATSTGVIYTPRGIVVICR